MTEVIRAWDDILIVDNKIYIKLVSNYLNKHQGTPYFSLLGAFIRRGVHLTHLRCLFKKIKTCNSVFWVAIEKRSLLHQHLAIIHINWGKCLVEIMNYSTQLIKTEIFFYQLNALLINLSEEWRFIHLFSIYINIIWCGKEWANLSHNKKPYF